MKKSNTAKQKVVYLDCQRYAAESHDFAQAYHRIFTDGARWDALEGSKAFSFIWTTKEVAALGKDRQSAMSDNPELAAELSLRLMQWRAAFLEWYLLLMKKECPAAFDDTQTQRSRDAAELGQCLGDKTERTTDRLIDFIKRRNELSEREWRMFRETAHESKPADWRHPELDTFLMLMWPIVQRFKWTHGDVFDAVQKKFPSRSAYPFNAAHNLVKHCSGLGLHTVNAPRTSRPHPRGKAPLFDLVQEISTQPDVLRRFGFLEK